MKRYREFMSRGECLLNALLSCIIPVLLILFCWLTWRDIPSLPLPGSAGCADSAGSGKLRLPLVPLLRLQQEIIISFCSY